MSTLLVWEKVCRVRQMLRRINNTGFIKEHFGCGGRVGVEIMKGGISRGDRE